MWIFPVLLFLAATPRPETSNQALADFGRINKAIGSEIAIVDLDGNVREGVLKSASSSDLTMRFGAGDKIFQRDVIAGAERLRDGTRDGAIKGAIFGGIIGLIMAGGSDSGADQASAFMTSVAVYSAIGWLFDASQTHREPLYRANVPHPTLKVSLRF